MKYPHLAYPDGSVCWQCKHPTRGHYDDTGRRMNCTEVVTRDAFRRDALAWQLTQKQNDLRDAAKRDNHPTQQPSRIGRVVA